jgi:hypothetical protein
MIIVLPTNPIFIVRIVRQYDRYGRQAALVHRKEDPLVEFYDSRYPFTPLGQFITRYYRQTLLNTQDGPLVLLDTGNPDWQVPAPAMRILKERLEELA